MEVLLANPADANNKGHVMNKITLAGRIFRRMTLNLAIFVAFSEMVNSYCLHEFEQT